MWAPGNHYGRSRTEVVEHVNGQTRAIATVWTHRISHEREGDTPDEQGMANLRLIVAAPKLYAALIEARDVLDGLNDDEINLELLPNINAALAEVQTEQVSA